MRSWKALSSTSANLFAPFGARPGGVAVDGLRRPLLWRSAHGLVNRPERKRQGGDRQAQNLSGFQLDVVIVVTKTEAFTAVKLIGGLLGGALPPQMLALPC